MSSFHRLHTLSRPGASTLKHAQSNSCLSKPHLSTHQLFSQSHNPSSHVKHSPQKWNPCLSKVHNHSMPHSSCLKRLQTRHVCAINSNSLKFDLNLSSSSCHGTSNRLDTCNNGLFQSSRRNYIRYSAPGQKEDFSQKNPHTYYGEVNTFQKGLLHLSKKTSYADVALYIICVWVSFFGAAYMASPLYRLLCQTFGWGGELTRRIDSRLQSLADWREQYGQAPKHKNRKFQIRFDSRTGPGMPWEFEPVQDYVITRAGESTLAFFTAENTSINPMTGLSIYTVLPFKAAPYFIKIQCFCFEEQRLRGKETVDMPVLFFVDPAILDDEKMVDCDEITLSYVFYPVEDGEEVEPDDDEDEFWQEEAQEGLLQIPVEIINVPAGTEIPQLQPQM